MDDQEILDNAPEGTTHIDRFGDYQKLNKNGESYQWTEMIFGNFKWHPEKTIVFGLRSLAGIKELVELRKANAELEAFKRHSLSRLQASTKFIDEQVLRIAELEKALTLTSNELSGAIDEINSTSSDLDEDPWDKETCHNNQVLLKAGT